VAPLDGGRISSDGGALLLCDTGLQLDIIKNLAQCFDDHQSPELTQ